MKKIPLYTIALLFTAAGTFAATAALVDREPSVIEIEVDAQDLARCQETLAQVAQMPAVTDGGSPILFDSADDLPQVACVVRDV
ncbi:hypothetical protein ACN2XU_11700 [Primorskyibacter sp. 2E107]|uniref:hypothetical protein n=1 Tax=Primorskyibacter sp. 2E107 TaxID=3403458 RepID=UPI003AF50FCE